MAAELFERKILKLLLQKDFYNAHGRFLKREIFPDDLVLAYDAIGLAHTKSESDLSLVEVKRLFEESSILTTPARRAFRDAIEELEDEPMPAPDIVGDIIRLVYRKERARQIAERAVTILNGDEDASFEDIARIATETEDAIGTSNAITPLDNSIEFVLKEASSDKRFPFYLSVLQEKITGAGPGNNIIIFARPEVGKSSFVAHNNIGYLRSGLKVAYFANEEPGNKIVLNHIRAFHEATEEELWQLVGKENIQWDEVRQNLSVYDAVDFSVSDIDRVVSTTGANVVVLDQSDKLKIGGDYGAEHARLKALYVGVREIAKRRDCLTINVSQASADAEGRRYLSMDMLDNSKTGKPGEADIVIGIGKDPGVDDTGLRYLTICKNKINGWHGTLTTVFNSDKCVWSA